MRDIWRAILRDIWRALLRDIWRAILRDIWRAILRDIWRAGVPQENKNFAPLFKKVELCDIFAGQTPYRLRSKKGTPLGLLICSQITGRILYCHSFIDVPYNALIACSMCLPTPFIKQANPQSGVGMPGI